MNTGERESVWNAMDAVTDDPIALSAAGVARRERLLADLSHAARGRRTRRVAVRSVGACALMLGVGSLAWMSLRAGSAAPTNSSGSREIAARDIRTPPPAPSPAPAPAPETLAVARVEIVSTDPSILSRYAVEAPAVEEISDEQLIEVMRQLGRPTGIIRTRGRVTLTADLPDPTVTGEPTSMGPAGGLLVQS